PLVWKGSTTTFHFPPAGLLTPTRSEELAPFPKSLKTHSPAVQSKRYKSRSVAELSVPSSVAPICVAPGGTSIPYSIGVLVCSARLAAKVLASGVEEIAPANAA